MQNIAFFQQTRNSDEQISRTALILMEKEYDLGVRHYRTREDNHRLLTSVD